jgi:hypothetical protein
MILSDIDLGHRMNAINNHSSWICSTSKLWALNFDFKCIG